MKNSDDDVYRWLTLSAATLVTFTTGSVSYASGIFHLGFLELFPDASTALLVWISSTYMCLFGAIGPIGGIIIDYFDCRTCVVLSGVLGAVGYALCYFPVSAPWMLVTYSLVAGSSIGLSMVGALMIAGYYFPERMTMASGVIVCGQSLGMFVFPSLVQILTETYGLRGTFLIIGGIAAQACVLGMLMIPSRVEKQRKLMRKRRSSQQTSKNKFQSIVRPFSTYTNEFIKKEFMYFLFSNLNFGMAIAVTFLYLPDFFYQNGVSKQTSAFAVSISGVSSCFSRLMVGVVSHDKRVGNGVIFSSISGIASVLTLLIMFLANSSAKVLTFGFLFGLYTGGLFSCQAPITVQILGLDRSSVGVGLVLFADGFGFLIGPPIARISFLLASVAGFLASASIKEDVDTVKEICVEEEKEQQRTDLLLIASAAE